MPAQIKSCPFCGSQAKVVGGGFGERFVSCINRNCGGRLGSGIWFTTDEKAIEVWNQRAEQGEVTPSTSANT